MAHFAVHTVLSLSGDGWVNLSSFSVSAACNILISNNFEPCEQETLFFILRWQCLIHLSATGTTWYLQRSRWTQSPHQTLTQDDANCASFNLDEDECTLNGGESRLDTEGNACTPMFSFVIEWWSRLKQKHCGAYSTRRDPGIHMLPAGTEAPYNQPPTCVLTSSIVNCASYDSCCLIR